MYRTRVYRIRTRVLFCTRTPLLRVAMADGDLVQNAGVTDTLSVVDEAFERSGLVPPPGDATTPFGFQPIDKYTYELLVLAGITVELLQQPGDLQSDGDPLYQVVQIVDESDMDASLEASTAGSISWFGHEDSLGLQVKLSASCSWKVTIKEELPIRRAGSAPARKRALVDSTSTQVFSNHSYEILFKESDPVPNPAMKTTIVNSSMISIVVTFKRSRDGGIVNDVDEFPAIDQRRVDVFFTNKHLTTMQV